MCLLALSVGRPWSQSGVGNNSCCCVWTARTAAAAEKDDEERNVSAEEERGGGDIAAGATAIREKDLGIWQSLSWLQALAEVKQIAEEFGWEVVDAGEIGQAFFLEALASLWVNYSIKSGQREQAFKLLSR